VKRLVQFLGLAVLAWASFEAAISWLTTCDPSYGYQPEQGGSDKHCSAVTGPLLSVAWPFLGRIALALEEHGEAVIAVFTVILAISTILLWRATERLWEAGEAQRRSSERIAREQRVTASHAAMSQRFATEASLNIARKSANAAVDSAKASNDAVAHMQQNAERQLRAYIGIEGGGFYAIKGRPWVRAEVRFKNYGQTPAHDVHIWQAISLFAPDAFTFDEDPEDVAGNPAENSVMSPLGVETLTTGQFSLAPGEFDDITSGKKVPITWGRARYRDVFDKEQTFTFTAKIGSVSLDEKGVYRWALRPAFGGYKST
jgi:hypothetical protein